MDLLFETDRLLLRPLKITDADEIFEMNNNPNVNRYLRNPIETLSETKALIDKTRNEYSKNGIGRYAVILKENNKLIGLSGLRFRDIEENGHSNFYDLGYRFSENYWRKGYAKEAALFWIHYGWNVMKLKTIYAYAESENTASNSLLKVIGFTFENKYIAKDIEYNWYLLKNKL